MHSHVVIIQARMGSTRFPGKSMYRFDGKPCLGYLIESLEQAFDRSSLCVATSNRPENDVIRTFCEQEHISCHSGDEDNVASRYVDILKENAVDVFIRVNGDSPLMDYRYIHRSLMNYEDSVDMISSVLTRRLPSGTNYEVVNTTTFLDAYTKFSSSEHFEHVTKYYYQNPELFNIQQADYEITDGESYDFSFDTAEDGRMIEKMLSEMDRPHYSYTITEKCRIYDRILEKEGR